MKEKKCLIVIDVQQDFFEDGALAVNNASYIIDPLNSLINAFTNVLFTQDWHPLGHHSFASFHKKDPFSTTKLYYGEQTLWPDHCIAESAGADFHPAINRAKCQAIFRKGFRKEIDSYSAFFENDHKTSTGLTGYLTNRDLKNLSFAGLATDYCVFFSAMDAVKQGFNVDVIQDASAAIDLDGSLERSLIEMDRAGIKIKNAKDFL